jgi:hypothetical protein
VSAEGAPSNGPGGPGGAGGPAGPGPGAGEDPAKLSDEQLWRALRESLGAFGAAGAGAGDESGHPHGAEQRCLELCPICRAADLLRASGSPELRGQLGDLQRELLLTVRSLIDHYVERLDARPDRRGGVEEIPID